MSEKTTATASPEELTAARALSTAALETVLSERKQDAKKARKRERDIRDGNIVILTEENRQTMRAAGERMEGVDFADTPGRKAVYPVVNKAKTEIVMVPVVVLDMHGERYLARTRDKMITLLPANWPLDFVDDATWTQALAAAEQEDRASGKGEAK